MVFCVILSIVIIMKSERLERKIKKATKEKNYEKAKEIITNEYIKHFKKMLKYKKVKYQKTWYLYDYIVSVNKEYKDLFGRDLDEMLDVLYSDKVSIKDQINWLIDNCSIFNIYKI